jgi:aminopeptidase YwaD
MFNYIFQAVKKEISGQNAKNLAREVTRFHRIQVSPHFREAAVWCCSQMKEWGLHCEVREFTADGNTMYWSYLLPDEWKVESAVLEIEGKPWADFRDEKVSLIQRSHPVTVEAEIVHIDGDDEKDFENVKGKIVHSPLPLEKIKDFALHYEAAGIITSGIREISERTRIDVPDAVHYFSFWGEKGSGFVLSPRQGENLKKMVKKDKKVKGRMVIKSSLYPGHMEVVDALIPGETDEEVLVVAHLCHPQPSANDNASGDGVLMEVARALNHLIDEKKLKKPKRGIRFLLVPEIHGTVAYLASHEKDLPKMVAALNLDMVGENQDLCKSSLLLERTPHAMPSFVNDLAEVIFEELTHEIGNFSDSTKYATFRHAVTPFSGGSDHLVLSDPSVGIPCPMVIQWPDMFYHSSLDTIDKIDPEAMKRVGILTATYAYFIASAGEEEAQWLAFIILEKAKERAIGKVRQAVTTLAEKELRKREKDRKKEKKGEEEKDRDRNQDFSGQLDYLLDRELHAIRSVKTLAAVDTEPFENELKKAVSTEKEKLQHETVPEKKKEEECTWVPVRKYPGPISTRKVLLDMSFEQRKAFEKKEEDVEGSRLLETLAVYWSDGKRTLSEINRLLIYEAGEGSIEFLKWYFEFLEEHGLIHLKR